MTIQYTGFGIHLKVADISRSRAFYEGALGLAPVFGYGNEGFRKTLPPSIPSVVQDGLPGAPERYCGVTYEPSPHAPLEIADGHIAVPDRAVFLEGVESPKISAMLRIHSLVPLIRDKRVFPKSSLKSYYWGTIEMVLRDPDGFVIVLIAPYSDAEMEALSHLTIVEKIAPG
jgi:catechol 2,3-dioxygenase-like lactoylglutathione lyase family enzyme